MNIYICIYIYSVYVYTDTTLGGDISHIRNCELVQVWQIYIFSAQIGIHRTGERRTTCTWNCKFCGFYIVCAALVGVHLKKKVNHEQAACRYFSCSSFYLASRLSQYFLFIVVCCRRTNVAIQTYNTAAVVLCWAFSYKNRYRHYRNIVGNLTTSCLYDGLTF